MKKILSNTAYWTIMGVFTAYVGWVCLQALNFYTGVVVHAEGVSITTPPVATVGLSGKSMATITYYSDVENCFYPKYVHGKRLCLMASGKTAYAGALACPRNIPLGTLIQFDGSYHVCEDRYSQNLSDRFDMFVGYGKDAYDMANQLGVHRAIVRVN